LDKGDLVPSKGRGGGDALERESGESPYFLSIRGNKREEWFCRQVPRISSGGGKRGKPSLKGKGKFELRKRRRGCFFNEDKDEEAEKPLSSSKFSVTGPISARK